MKKKNGKKENTTLLYGKQCNIYRQRNSVLYCDIVFENVTRCPYTTLLHIEVLQYIPNYM